MGYTAYSSAHITMRKIMATKIILTNGNDKISGTANADNLDALAGNDTILGLGGNDTLIGNIGNDSLNGGQQFRAYQPSQKKQ